MFPSRPQAHAGARALGWLGIAIGVAQLVAPRRVASAIGVPDNTSAMRGCGLREVATGVALLASDRPTTWMWARVAGDVLDAGLLARVLRTERSGAPRLALLALGAIALADLVLARRLGRPAPVAAVDYTRRSGFPLAVQQMRGIARSDLAVPADMRAPQALRPWNGERREHSVRIDTTSGTAGDTTNGSTRDTAG